MTPENFKILTDYIVGLHTPNGVDSELMALSDGAIFYELMDYFSEEMPYGVAKARTGEPDVWIEDKLLAMTVPEFQTLHTRLVKYN